MMPSPLNFRAHMRAKSHFPALKANHFRKVPVEIVEAIFRLLIRLDQICFALSCKSIYAIHGQQKHLSSENRPMSSTSN